MWNAHKHMYAERICSNDFAKI